MASLWATWATACSRDCLPARLMYMSSLLKTCCLALRKGPSFPCTGHRSSELSADDCYTAWDEKAP